MNTSAMVALLPSNDSWCRQDLAHMTVVYLGELEDLSDTLRIELTQKVSDLACLMRGFSVKVLKQEIFGTDESVDVLTIDKSPQVLALRSFFQDHNASEHTDYSPHVTIGPHEALSENTSKEPSPMYLTFNRIGLFWGDEQVVFYLPLS